MSPTHPISVAVLAGGRSSRMGKDKALLPWKGKTLLEHQIQMLESLHPMEIFISGQSSQNFPDTGHPVLPDDLPGLGPIGGIATILRQIQTSHLLVLAVDMPRITPALLTTLMESAGATSGCAPWQNNRWEPLAALYPRCLYPLLEYQISKREISLQPLLQAAEARGEMKKWCIPEIHKKDFTNLNFPEDLDEKNVIPAKSR